MTDLDDLASDPEPVHGWFGLSYSQYQVLNRTLMQSMPLDWQRRMVACLRELEEAYDHIEQPDCYIVEPADEVTYSDLSAAQMRRLGITCGPEPEDVPFMSAGELASAEETFYDRDGCEHQAWDRLLVPTGGDPVPRYNRGRTYIPPWDGRPPLSLSDSSSAEENQP